MRMDRFKVTKYAKDGSILRTELIGTKWFPEKEAPKANIVDENNEMWVNTTDYDWEL